uniref:Uncharacterized protein n=1 Tax=Strongyloides venezuelensis TaxID=75913 RepID=A0A0K0FYX8_STRVS
MSSITYDENYDVKEQLVEILDQSMVIKSCLQTILFDFTIIIVCIAFLSSILFYYGGKLFLKKYKELVDFKKRQNNLYHTLNDTGVFYLFL